MASEAESEHVVSVEYHPEYIKHEHAGPAQVEANLVVFTRSIEMAKAYRLAKATLRS